MGLILSLLVGAAVIFAVDKMMEDMTVAGPVTCVKVAALNAVISFGLFLVIPQRLLTLPFAVFGSSAWSVAIGVANLLIAGLSLYLSDKLLEDFQLKGFKSAVVAAVLIAVVRSAAGVVLGV